MNPKYAGVFLSCALFSCVFEADEHYVNTENDVDRPPAIFPQPDQSLHENMPLNFTVTASDPDSDVVAITALTLPAGASFVGGTFSWTPSYSQAGIFSLRFRAQSHSLADTDTVVVTVDNSVVPGVYRGDYEAVTGIRGAEYELNLGANGRFRTTSIQGFTPFYIAKGEWESAGETMLWKNFVGVYSHNGTDFGFWQALSPDTSFLRKISDTSFERLEVVFDTLEGPVMRWVPYRSVNPPPAPTDGRYEYQETYRDPIDSTRTVSGLAFIEFRPGGIYHDGRFADGKPMYEFTADQWTQTGSFIVTANNHYRYYNDSLQAFDPWQDEYSDFEYVFRIRNVSADSFQSWQVQDASYQGYPFWASYRRVP